MFRALKDIGNDIASLLQATGKFKKVGVAAVSGGKQMMAFIAALRTVPAAVVCIGPGDYEQLGFVRKMSAVIVVIAPFRADLDSQASEVWTLMESASQPFIPTLTEGGERAWQTVNGVIYEPKGWAPLEHDDPKLCAFAFELNTTEEAGEWGDESQPAETP